MEKVLKNRWGPLLVGLAVLMVGLAAWSRLASSKTASTAPDGTTASSSPIPVSLATTQRASLPISLSGHGRAEGSAWVHVKPRIDGLITDVLFTEGAQVHAGDPLFRLDQRLLEARMREAEAALKKDIAQYKRRKSDMQRDEGLLSQGFLSRSAIESERAELEVAQASVDQRRAALEIARLEWTHATIVAPIDGTAGAAQLTVGGSVKANETALVAIHRTGPTIVSFKLPESDLASLKRAAGREVVEVQADPGDNGATLIGQLSFVDSAVDTKTGTIELKARFKDTEKRLTPGQFVRVRIPVDQVADALIVPAEAVQAGLEGPFVFIVGQDGTVAARSVTLGPAAGASQSVRQGLAEGEVVVREGAARLREGSRVTAQGQGLGKSKGG
jgi:multidrug efflux system membrane fusion protein